MELRRILMAWDFGTAFNTVLLAMVNNPFYLIFVIVGVAMVPLSFLGIKQLYGWLDNWAKVRSGYLKVYKKLSNGRWIRFWARPVGRRIKVKGEEGQTFEIPIRIEKNMLGYISDIKGNFAKATRPSMEELKAIKAQVTAKAQEPGPKIEVY